MNLAGQKGAHPGGVVVRVIEYRVDGGEVIRLLTDLADPVAFPAGELAALYHQRWEGEGSFRQVKTFQRGRQEILRSADPELVRQEIWAHLAVHHCLTRIIMRLAAGERIDPDRISFIKVLKHVRRSVIRQSAQTSVQIKQVMAMLAAKVRRKLDNGIRRLREADRALKRPASKYSFRKAGPGPPSHPPGGRQGAHAPSRDSSVSQATALGDQATVPPQDSSWRDQPVYP